MEMVLAAAAIQLAAALKEGQEMLDDDYQIDNVEAKFAYKGQKYKLTLELVD